MNRTDDNFTIHSSYYYHESTCSSSHIDPLYQLSSIGYFFSDWVVIQNLNDDFTPKDELDYVNYLKLILGRQDVSTKLSDSLVELTSNKRYSSENSVRRVVIAFVPFASDDDVAHSPYRNNTNLKVQRRLSSRVGSYRNWFSRPRNYSSLRTCLQERNEESTNWSRHMLPSEKWSMWFAARRRRWLGWETWWIWSRRSMRAALNTPTIPPEE